MRGENLGKSWWFAVGRMEPGQQDQSFSFTNLDANHEVLGVLCSTEMMLTLAGLVTCGVFQ